MSSQCLNSSFLKFIAVRNARFKIEITNDLRFINLSTMHHANIYGTLLVNRSITNAISHDSNVIMQLSDLACVRQAEALINESTKSVN